MQRYATTAIRLLGQADTKELLADERTLLSICYAVQTIGEAANKVSAETRSQHPDIPWAEIIGMRHHLVHGYETIRVHVVATTVRNDLPPVIASLRRVLKDIPE